MASIPSSIATDVGIALGVAAFEPRVGDKSWTAVTRAADEQRVEVSLPDHPIEMGVYEVEAGARAPVSKEPRFDVLWIQWSPQKWIGHQIDLTDRQVVRGTKVSIKC